MLQCEKSVADATCLTALTDVCSFGQIPGVRPFELADAALKKNAGTGVFCGQFLNHLDQAIAHQAIKSTLF